MWRPFFFALFRGGMDGISLGVIGGSRQLGPGGRSPLEILMELSRDVFALVPRPVEYLEIS